MVPVKKVWDPGRSLRLGLELQVCLVFIGISWKDKVADLRVKMAERNVVWFVVTALDEIACEYTAFTVFWTRYRICPLVLWESVCSCHSAFEWPGNMHRLCHQTVIGSAKEEEDGGGAIGSRGEECSLALSSAVRA